MITRRRLLASLLVAIFGVLLAFGWALSTRGYVEGTVYTGEACPGNPPKNVPNYGCTAPVPAANVTVVFSSSDGFAGSVLSDRGGRYWLTLPADIYMVAAWQSKWEEVSSNGIRSVHPRRETQFWPVRISGGQKARINLAFPTFAI
jgi:hypothetical protein